MVLIDVRQVDEIEGLAPPGHASQVRGYMILVGAFQAPINEKIGPTFSCQKQAVSLIGLKDHEFHS